MKQTITNRSIEKQQYWDNSRDSAFSTPLRRRKDAEEDRNKRERERESESDCHIWIFARTFWERCWRKWCRRRGSSPPTPPPPPPSPPSSPPPEKGGSVSLWSSVLTLRRALRRHTELWKLAVTDKSHTHTHALGMDSKVLALVAVLTLAIWSPETDGKGLRIIFTDLQQVFRWCFDVLCCNSVNY